MTPQTNQVIRSPEIVALQETIRQLNDQLAQTLTERDYLVYVICKNLEMDYMLRIGHLEYDMYQLEWYILRLMRKLEYIQAAINRSEPINLEAIEEALDDDFLTFKIKLEEKLEALKRADERKNSQWLNEEQTAELKRIYRKLVKLLHPDLNPSQSEEMLFLYHRAVDAYERGDLVSLQSIENLNLISSGYLEQLTTIEALLQEEERLTSLLLTMQADITDIYGRFPYNQKELLQDDVAVTKCQEEIKSFTSYLEGLQTTYEQKIQEKLRNYVTPDTIRH